MFSRNSETRQFGDSPEPSGASGDEFPLGAAHVEMSADPIQKVLEFVSCFCRPRFELSLQLYENKDAGLVLT
jgi:hypothetical protein